MSLLDRHPSNQVSTSLLISNARVVSASDSGGNASSHPIARSVQPATDILIAHGTIAAVGHGLRADPEMTVIDAAGRVVMPGFVDCHTHLCWAGDRLDEWEMKQRGTSYLELLAAGGGIMSTVRAVRGTSREQLTELLLNRLNIALSLGTTTIEIKSGYGLSTDSELKMLRAIGDAALQWPGTIVRTALLGHAIDADLPRERFIETTIHETLDAVHAEFPGITIDAYCESGAWSLEECIRLFERAISLGHPIRVHADQFNSLGMIQAAIRLGAGSVDHLEASTTADLQSLAESNMFGVVLPCCGFHVDNRYASPRTLLDHRSPRCGGGGRVCIATNANPGSAPCFSMPMAMSIAVRRCSLTTHEAILAATAHPAALLGFTDRGRIAPGFRADLLMLDTTDERDLTYQFGHSPIAAVICGGHTVWCR